MKLFCKNLLIVFSIIWACCSHKIVAQNKNVDSLYNDLLQTKDIGGKLTKALPLVEQISNISDTNKIRTIISIIESLEVSQSQTNIKQGLVLYSKGVLCAKINNHKKSLEYTQKAIALLNGYKNLIVKSQTLIVKNYYLSNSSMLSSISCGLFDI